MQAVLHSALSSVFRRKARGERGQVLMMAALMLPVLLGMSAMAIDVGRYADNRTSLQHAADSIALAASRDLPSESAATATAATWAAKNGIDTSKMTVIITGVSSSNPNPRVEVQINETHNFAFMQVLGIDSKPVGARAVAIKTTPGGAGMLKPWMVLESVKNAASPGDLITLKYDSNNPQNGNFGAIRIDGSGSSLYEDTIINGSTSVICAKLHAAPCIETSPICDNQSVCQSETGNKIGPTRTGVDYLMNATSGTCDSFGEAFSGGAGGKYNLNPQCNPWTDGGKASKRVIIIPVIDQLCNGNCDVTVMEFALFYLEGYDSGKCSGNECEIKGRFVNADVTVNATAGIYDPDSSMHFTRMVE